MPEKYLKKKKSVPSPVLENANEEKNDISPASSEKSSSIIMLT